ncbi:MAG: hypothetical protein ACXWLR_11985 [Myxococcales bacterium]
MLDIPYSGSDPAALNIALNKALAKKIYFLECNPLPGLTPGWSDLVLIAKGTAP